MVFNGVHKTPLSKRPYCLKTVYKVQDSKLLTNSKRIQIGFRTLLAAASIHKIGRFQSQNHILRESVVGYVRTGSTQASVLQADDTFCEKKLSRNAMDEKTSMSIFMDSNSYARILQGCIETKALVEGKRTHACIMETGFYSHTFLENRLIEMYAKCGNMVDARRVFDKMTERERNVYSWNLVIAGYTKSGSVQNACDLFDKMPERNEVSWNTLIAGFSQHGQTEKAMSLFSQMHMLGTKPTQFTFASVANVCGDLLDLGRGEQLHGHVIKSGFESNIFVGNALVDMYAKCGTMEFATQLFDTMYDRDKVSWTAMITGFSQSGQAIKAMNCFVQMRRTGVKPDKVTYSSILSACAKRGVLDSDIQLLEATSRNVGYTQSRLDDKETLEMAFEMQQMGMKVNRFTFGNSVNVSDYLFAFEIGKQIHSQVIKDGSESNVFVGNALVDMYSKCRSIKDAERVFKTLPECNVVSWNVMIAGYGHFGLGGHALKTLYEMRGRGINPDQITFATVVSTCAKSGLIEDARKLFDEMSEHSVISWNTIIAGYVHNGHGEEAFTLFRQMQLTDIKIDQITMIIVLSACSSHGGLEYGKQVHVLVIKAGLESNVFVGSALVDMYAKCGNIKNAHAMFKTMPKLDGVAWNTLIAGYAQHSHGEEALTIFQQMQWVGIKPTQFTFGSILSACARLGALGHGKQVHAQIIKIGFLSNVFAESALVDMYSKCGCIEDAGQVFNNMSARNAVSWNGMIMGYAHNGCGKKALQLFEEMIRIDEKPDHATFIGVLSACNHTGLVDEGLYYFYSMTQCHSITPQANHYACIIDLLGRSGRLNEAEEFINKMPYEPDAIIWGTLLGACRTHDNIELGRHAAECLLELEPENPAPYVLLSHIYAASGRWDDVANLRTRMKGKEIKKEPGCSWIEVKGRVHAFLVEDR